MALLTVLDTEGKPHLVHSSIFDRGAYRLRLGLTVEESRRQWSEVWKYHDDQKPNPRSEP